MVLPFVLECGVECDAVYSFGGAFPSGDTLTLRVRGFGSDG